MYAVVQDVPASWEHYAPIADAMGDPAPRGLILHVAGPTDEGFRTIDVWETREAFERFRDVVGWPDVSAHARWAAPTLRALRAVAAVHGGVAPTDDGDGEG